MVFSLIRITALFAAVIPSMATAESAGRDDAAWLREEGTLIFEDAFEREEDGNLAKAIGNGWNSATADRVPDTKQADLDGGILKVTTSKAAGHGAHIHHDAGFEDGGAIVRFKLPGLDKHESLTVGFVDRECKGIHAGHLGYVFINGGNPLMIIRDHKTGVSDLAIRERRSKFLQAKEKLPPDLQEILDAKETTVSWKPDNEWHELVLVTEGDEMRVSLDGKLLGGLRSPGFAHPVKRWFSLGVGTTAWVDDVKVYRVK